MLLHIFKMILQKRFRRFQVTSLNGGENLPVILNGLGCRASRKDVFVVNLFKQLPKYIEEFFKQIILRTTEQEFMKRHILSDKRRVDFCFFLHLLDNVLKGGEVIFCECGCCLRQKGYLQGAANLEEVVYAGCI